MRVFIYWNLHKQCWSIKALEGNSKGRVIAHAYSFQLKDVIYKVSQKGRQRVLAEKRKNVHAGVTGELIIYTDAASKEELTIWPGFKFVTYNPYKYSTFVIKDNEEPIHKSSHVIAVGRSVCSYA